MNVRLADEEPFRFLVKGAAEAAEMFAALTDEERDALPDAALSGIARLREAIAEFTGEVPLPEPREDEPLRYGLVIEWPGPPATGPARISPNLVSVFEADALGAERQLPGVTRLTLRLSPDEPVSADVETILGEDGEPIRLKGEPAWKDDRLARGVFCYEVAAVRVRDTGH
jgi:hypothetical protein